MNTRTWTLAALLLLLVAGTGPDARAQSAARDLYDQARAALDDRDYGRAAEYYGQVAEEYPDSRQAPEALYWQAFALMREGGRQDLLAAKRALERQFDRYPDEARRGDSQELAIRIQSRLAEMGDARAAEEILRLADQLGDDEGGSLDREEETRMAALHALLQVDSDRALPLLRKVLIENPQKYSEEFRNQALFMVSQAADDEEALDILLHVVRHDESGEIRGQAVFWLSQTHSDRAVEILDSLLSDPGEDDEVRGQAVFALSQIGGTESMATLRRVAADPEVDEEVRANAIFWLGQMGGRGESVQFLVELYPDLDEVELKDKVIFSVAQGGGEAAGDFLMGIVRDADEDVELRNNALFWLGQTDRIDEQQLVDMIGTIDEPELAEQVVFVLSQRGGKAAVEALIELARTAEDPEIREKAIFWLGQSGDPRAAEYLEELVGGDW